MNRTLLSARLARFVRAGFAVALLSALTPALLHSQTFTPLYDFGVVDGSQDFPNGQLARGRDGNFYGTMNQNTSRIYEISAAGTETLLWAAPTDLGNADVCYTGLTLGPDGLFYGTCALWDSNKSTSGVIFKYDPSKGANGLSLIYSFPQFNATAPTNPSALVLGSDGNFYGTTSPGGNSAATPYGTVFKVTPAGVLTTLHVFLGQTGNDGGYPSPAPLIQGKDGNFYGTTDEGGLSGQQNGGSVYKITPKGAVKILYFFENGTIGLSGVVQGTNGDFYGNTAGGGTSGEGTFFQLTAAGKIEFLHSYDLTADVIDYPLSPLTLGTDGNFYGSASNCLSGGCSLTETLYKITPKGVLSNLFDQFSCSGSAVNGCIPSSPLLLDTNGMFYGTAQQGGSEGRGVFFSLNTKLAPFVELSALSGKIGSKLSLSGQGFTKATKVSFDGKAVTVKSTNDTFMTVTVPAGALTGTVSVIEGSTTLKSGTIFKVTPTQSGFTPASGAVGTAVVIDGTGLTQTTKVTFGGVAATSFTVDSDTQVTVDVPAGAKTGKITVVTAGGSVASSTVFTVN